MVCCAEPVCYHVRRALQCVTISETRRGQTRYTEFRTLPFDSVAPTARSFTSRAFNFSFPALDTSRAWRSQKTSSHSDRARTSQSPSIRTSRWSRRDSLDSFLAVSLMLSVLCFSRSRRLFSWRICLFRRTASLLRRVMSLRSVLMVSFWSGDRSRAVRRRRVSAGRGPIAPSRASGATRALRSRDFLTQRLDRGAPMPASEERGSPDFLTQRLDRGALVRLDAGFAEERLQARHFALQGRHVPCRAASFLGLLDGLAQPAPASFEPRLPRTGIATLRHFRPA